MLSLIPRRNCWLLSLVSPTMPAFPVLLPGRLPHHTFRGLLSVHSCYGLHARRVPYRTLYTRGFSRFVTSTAAPVATGRSESCRAGFAPAGKQRLCTAHNYNELYQCRDRSNRIGKNYTLVHSGRFFNRLWMPFPKHLLLSPVETDRLK